MPKINILSNYGKSLVKSRFPESIHPRVYQTILQNDLLIYGFFRHYRSHQILFMILSNDIIDTVSKFYTYIYPQMITMDGTLQIKSILDKGGYAMSAMSEFPSVRTDIAIKKEQGKYYYEFKVTSTGSKILFTNHDLAQIGWCTDLCLANDYLMLGIGDDEHSWAFDGGRVKKWHSGSGEYGKSWELNDIVGCAVDVHKGGDKFDIGYYLNGEYLGIAFENCTYDGDLYPAFSFQKFYAHGSFIFHPTHMKYIPAGYEPII